MRGGENMDNTRKRIKNFIVFWSSHCFLCVGWISFVFTAIFTFLILYNIPISTQWYEYIIRSAICILSMSVSLFLALYVYMLILDICANLNKKYKLRINVERIFENKHENASNIEENT